MLACVGSVRCHCQMKQLNSKSSFRYQIDASDCITFVDSAWKSFAERNNTPELTRRSIVGKSIWNFISGREVRHLYDLIFHVVRSRDREIVIPFRCDSPTIRRFMTLTIAPVQGGNLALVGALIREEPRPHVALLGSEVPDLETLVSICSWCKRVQLRDSSWVEVEQAIHELGLFQSDGVPGLTHGICPDCMFNIRDEIGQTRDS